MIYVLIVMSIYSGGALTTQEFSSKDRCEVAKQQVLQQTGNQYFKAVCVQK